MNRDRKLLYIGNALFLGVLLLVLFVPNANSIRYVLAVLLMLFAVLVQGVIKKRPLLSIHARQVTALVVLIALVYVMLYYLTGLRFGFYPSLIRFSGKTVLSYILPTMISVIASECIRQRLYIKDSLLMRACLLVSFALLDVWMHISPSEQPTFYAFVDDVGLVLFPAITGNLLYQHLSSRYGIFPGICYRGILELYLYILPYTPATPTSLVAFAKLVVPLLVWLFLSILYDKREYASSGTKSALYFVGGGGCLLGMAAVVMLISCQFRFGMLVVGSESMVGALEKGDCVVYERHDDGALIQKEQIIIFEKDGRKIIHRVTDIRRINGELRYYTKGDANEEADDGYITEHQIIGTVRTRLCYIGYPTVWLKEQFAKIPNSKTLQ